MEEQITSVQENVTETPIETTETNTTEDTTESIANELSDNENNIDNQESVEEQSETQEQENVDENKEVEEQEEFDPEDLDFDKEDEETPIYKDIEGYDLEEYKDIFDFDNEESLSFIKDELGKLKKAGFNQEQADLYIKSHLQSYQEEQAEEEKLHSKEYVKEKLKAKLSKEEQRNYKPILNLMKEISSTGAFPKEWITDAMSNPNLVKILNGIYKHQTNTNTVKEVPQPKQKATMTPTMAFEKYTDWIVSQKDTTLDKTSNFVESLRPYILEKDMDEFNQIFKSVIKK